TTIYTSNVIIHTSQKYRRVEIDFTVGYAYDIRRITAIIQDALSAIAEIRTDPPVQILCWQLGSTSLEINARWWIAAERAQEVISRTRAIQAIKEAFDANDIDPTDPQLIYYRSADKSSPLTTGESESRPAAAPPQQAAPDGPPPAIEVSADDPESY